MKFNLMSLVLCLITIAVPSLSFADNVIDLQGADAQKKLVELRGQLEKDPENAVALKDAGIILHQLSRKTPSKEQVEEGEKYLKKALKKSPDDVELSAWLGSITTMKAQFDTDPGRQTFFVKSGSQYLDNAVRKAPDNTVVRLTRAYNSLEIPPFLKRTRFAVEDFEYYLSACTKQTCPAKELSAAKQGLEQAKKILATNGQ